MFTSGTTRTLATLFMFLLPHSVDFSGDFIKRHFFFRQPLSDLGRGDRVKTFENNHIALCPDPEFARTREKL